MSFLYRDPILLLCDAPGRVRSAKLLFMRLHLLEKLERSVLKLEDLDMPIIYYTIAKWGIAAACAAEL